MRTQRDDLIFIVSTSLGKGLTHIRGMKRSLTLEEQKRIAEKIISDLEQFNWSITLKEQRKLPSI